MMLLLLPSFRTRSLAPIAISRLRVLINPNCTRARGGGEERKKREREIRGRERRGRFHQSRLRRADPCRFEGEIQQLCLWYAMVVSPRPAIHACACVRVARSVNSLDSTRRASANCLGVAGLASRLVFYTHATHYGV